MIVFFTSLKRTEQSTAQQSPAINLKPVALNMEMSANDHHAILGAGVFGGWAGAEKVNEWVGGLKECSAKLSLIQ